MGELIVTQLFSAVEETVEMMALTLIKLNQVFTLSVKNKWNV